MIDTGAHPPAETPLTDEHDSTGAMAAAWFGTPGAGKAIDRVFPTGAHPHVGGGRNPHYEGCFEDETPAQAEERWRVASTEARVRTTLLVMHPDDPALKLLPDGTTVVLQRNLPRTPV